MIKCLLCNKETERPKYCSKQCVKKSWYLRNNPDVASYAIGNPDFWKTETGIGFKWEKWASKLLGAKHLTFNNSGGDLDWNGKIVDVKSSNIYKRLRKRGKPVVSEQKGVWSFARGKMKKIDYFLCICLIRNKPHKVLLIPGKSFSKTGIVVGWKSKYDRSKY